MPQVLDIEQSVLLLELEAPFDKREVQLARRRLAKVWHPDLAPLGKQHEHERHLKSINEAADQLERLAEDSRGGQVSRNAVKVSAAAAREARAEAGRRNYEAEQAARANAAEQRKHDPFGSRTPDHSVVHRYARCLSYPEWGVGSVTGIYFTGDSTDPDADIQQWARVTFQIGVRTVPAGSLQFVDFGKPDPGAERVQRFLVAAQHATAEGNHALAARRLIHARNADADNTAVLRLLTDAFWHDGDLPAAGRAVRDWIRVERDRPAPHRTAARIYEDMGAIDLAAEAAERAAARAAQDASEWERVGRLRLRLEQLEPALAALERARRLGPSEAGLLDLARVFERSGDLGGEVTASEQATQLAPGSPAAWSAHARALGRTDRTSDALAAAERARSLAPDDPELDELVAWLADQVPRALRSA